MLRRFLAAENGATGIEYAVLAAVAGAVLLPFCNSLSGTLSSPFTALNDALGPEVKEGGVTVAFTATTSAPSH